MCKNSRSGNNETRTDIKRTATVKPSAQSAKFLVRNPGSPVPALQDPRPEVDPGYEADDESDPDDADNLQPNWLTRARFRFEALDHSRKPTDPKKGRGAQDSPMHGSSDLPSAELNTCFKCDSYIERAVVRLLK